jgi:hypothetical protein
MDMNNTPEPRMPLVENLEFFDLMGVISSPCIICGVRIRRSAGELRWCRSFGQVPGRIS